MVFTFFRAWIPCTRVDILSQSRYYILQAVQFLDDFELTTQEISNDISNSRRPGGYGRLKNSKTFGILRNRVTVPNENFYYVIRDI